MALSAGQLMEKGEINGLKAATGVADTTFTATLALLTAAPTATDIAMSSETEYAATGYARQAYGPTTPTAASPSVASNTSTITFGPFTASVTGTITWAMLCDSTAGGTSLPYAAFLLGTARTPLTGDSLQCAASAFTLTLT